MVTYISHWFVELHRINLHSVTQFQFRETTILQRTNNYSAYEAEHLPIINKRFITQLGQRIKNKKVVQITF